jgi:hypothetical protein
VDRELGIAHAQVVGDRAQQVRLAEPGRPVQEEWVVGLAGSLGDREGGGVGDAVAGADDEALEAVGGIELDQRGAGPAWCRPRVAGVLIEEADLVEVAEGLGDAVEEAGVAPLDPGSDLLWRAQVQGGAARGGDGDGLDPDLEGRFGERRSQLLTDALPGACEILPGAL